MAKGNGKKNGKADKPEVGTLPATLTDKQRRFVEEYCVDFNGTQAAIRAGYSGDSAASIAWENLRKPEIREAVQGLMRHLTMSAGEAAVRLTRWGRGTVAPFLRITGDGEAKVDLSTAEAQDALDLVRKIRQTENTVRGKDGDEYTTVRTEIELHDAKDAVIQMAKLHGMFREEGESPDRGLSPRQRAEVWDAIQQVKTIQQFERLLVGENGKLGSD
jgi:phage terminase small subunit